MTRRYLPMKVWKALPDPTKNQRIPMIVEIPHDGKVFKFLRSPLGKGYSLFSVVPMTQASGKGV